MKQKHIKVTPANAVFIALLVEKALAEDFYHKVDKANGPGFLVNYVGIAYAVLNDIQIELKRNK